MIEPKGFVFGYGFWVEWRVVVVVLDLSARFQSEVLVLDLSVAMVFRSSGGWFVIVLDLSEGEGF